MSSRVEDDRTRRYDDRDRDGPSRRENRHDVESRFRDERSGRYGRDDSKRDRSRSRDRDRDRSHRKRRDRSESRDRERSKKKDKKSK
jgi:transformer-2 protein